MVCMILPSQDMGGTRKGEAMCRIARNIIKNFRKYAVGLHAKVSRKRAGHGPASVGDLLSLGRRLLSADFITVVVVFNDVMEKQRLFTLPWLAEKSFHQKQRQIDDDLLFLAILLHYCDKATLRCLVDAHLYTPWGKRFSCFLINLSDILILRRFHGVEFHSFTDLPRAQFAQLHIAFVLQSVHRAGRSQRLLRQMRLGEEGSGSRKSCNWTRCGMVRAGAVWSS